MKVLFAMLLIACGALPQAQQIHAVDATPRIKLVCTEWRVGWMLTSTGLEEFVWCNEWLETSE